MQECPVDNPVAANEKRSRLWESFRPLLGSVRGCDLRVAVCNSSPTPYVSWLMLCRLSRLFGSLFASQNYRNQQEITRKQRAEMGQQEAMTGAGTMEEAASKWKVGGKTELDPPMYVSACRPCWIKMNHRSPNKGVTPSSLYVYPRLLF